MILGYFSHLLEQFKTAAKKAAEAIYPLRKNKLRITPSTFQMEASSMKGLHYLYLEIRFFFEWRLMTSPLSL